MNCRALEQLAARIMEQSGVVQKESPEEGVLNRIKKFANQFLNANSDGDDIVEYGRELNTILNDVQVRIIRGSLSRANVLHQTALTVNIAITVNRLDKKADNLKALIFLEGEM